MSGGTQYNGIVYAVKSGGTWNLETIGAGAAGPTYLAIDSANKIYINDSGFFNPGVYIYYATNAGGTWETETIADSGLGSSMTIDSSNNVHIIYYDPTNVDLKYATKAL